MKTKKEKSICRLDVDSLSNIQAGAILVFNDNGSINLNFSDEDRQQFPFLPTTIIFNTHEDLVSWLATTPIDKQIIRNASPDVYRQITHSARYFFYKVFRHPR